MNFTSICRPPVSKPALVSLSFMARSRCLTTLFSEAESSVAEVGLKLVTFMLTLESEDAASLASIFLELSS